jgi:photosystem II stability/assembly factor-like uncharacterized protein
VRQVLLLCLTLLATACASASAAESHRVLVPMTINRAPVALPPGLSPALRPPTSPVTDDLDAVAAVSDTVAWAVGDQGAILKSVDGGATWQRQISGQRRRLHAVAAISEQVAWVATGGPEGTILKTTDGGTTWIRQQAPTTNELWGISAVSASIAWAAGDDGVFATTDGGTTWSRQDVGQHWGLRGIHAPTERDVWTVGPGTIATSSDGGRTWTTRLSVRLDNPAPERVEPVLNRVVAVSARVGWAVGTEVSFHDPSISPDRSTVESSSLVYATRDGGATWTASRPSWSDLYAVAAASEQRVWTGGFNFLTTVDGGASWVDLPSVDPGRAITGMAVAGRTLWLVGQRGLVRTGTLPTAAR